MSTIHVLVWGFEVPDGSVIKTSTSGKWSILSIICRSGVWTPVWANLGCVLCLSCHTWTKTFSAIIKFWIWYHTLLHSLRVLGRGKKISVHILYAPPPPPPHLHHSFSKHKYNTFTFQVTGSTYCCDSVIPYGWANCYLLLYDLIVSANGIVTITNVFETETTTLTFLSIQHF